MRTVYNLINATGKNLGIFSKEKEAETAKAKSKEEGLYILQTFEPETPSEIASAKTEFCEFRHVKDFKPYSPEAIAQERNEKDFDTLSRALGDMITEYDALLEEQEKREDSEKEIRELLRQTLCWLDQEEGKAQSENKKEAETSRDKFFDVLMEEIKETAREAGFWKHGRIYLEAD